MRKHAFALILMLGLYQQASAQCNIGLVLRSNDICLNGFTRFITTSISGATYRWSVLGTSWVRTTSTNSVDLFAGELPIGSYTMSVQATCQVGNCTYGSPFRYSNFSVNCITPRKVQASDADAGLPVGFDTAELALWLADEAYYRVREPLPGSSYHLANMTAERGQFIVVSVNLERQLTAEVVVLEAGEALESRLPDPQGSELIVLSKHEFVLATGDQEKWGTRNGLIPAEGPLRR